MQKQVLMLSLSKHESDSVRPTLADYDREAATASSFVRLRMRRT